mmetsp:Transcript_15792/g.45143  ORF Transcript_15792/g.45143 Transcript_15792/m.45143 type:complete len:260 (-) Transcript_15792:702-1481(-)
MASFRQVLLVNRLPFMLGRYQDFHRLVVLGPPLEEVKVPIQALLRCLALFLVRVVLIFLINPAVVISPRVFPMPAPVSQAKPAKMMPAAGAVHVHAPLVLLDWPLARRTWLCVGNDPVHVRPVRGVLQFPTLHDVTAGHRAVRLPQAIKAEVGVTPRAANILHARVPDGFMQPDVLVAVHTRAHTDIPNLVHKVGDRGCLDLFKILGRGNLGHQVAFDHPATFRNRAVYAQGRRRILRPGRYIAAPAFEAEPVPTAAVQ